MSGRCAPCGCTCAPWCVTARAPSSAVRACGGSNWTSDARSACSSPTAPWRVRFGTSSKPTGRSRNPLPSIDYCVGLSYFPSRELTRIDDLTEPRDRLEEQVIADDLDEGERSIGVEALRGHRRFVADVATPQLRRAALHDVDDPLLWLQPLVEVLVAREDHVHAVLDEQRFDHASADRAPIRAARLTNRSDGGSRRSSTSRPTA